MQIIPPALFNFHFFDGEKVSNFMFDRANGQAFRKAFLQICGLDTFDLIEEQLQYNTRTKKGDSQNLIQEEYATARMKLAEAKESHIASLQKIQETQAEIDALQDQITILDADMKNMVVSRTTIGNCTRKKFKRKNPNVKNYGIF